VVDAYRTALEVVTGVAALGLAVILASLISGPRPAVEPA
jgi:hypothetical protein